MHGHGNPNAHTGPRLAVAPDVHRRRWSILGVLSLSLLITAIDHTIMNVALPRMVTDLGASTSQLQWIVDSYTVVFAGLLLAAGALGDRFGRKGALQFGLAAFVGGSVFAALSDSAAGVISARAVMGIGGAFIMPATLSILTNAFGDPAERAKAIGVWAGVSGIGVALGPIAGGYLLEHFGWSSVFWLNVPVALGALVVGHRILPRSKADDGRRLDPLGAVLSITALTALVYAVIEAPAHGWTSTWTITALGAALALGILFIGWEMRHHTPMLDVRFFVNPSFSAASTSVTFAFFALAGAIFMVTQYLQFVLGYSPLRAGLGILPTAAAIAVAGPISAHVAQHVGGRTTIAAGLFITSAGLCEQALFAETVLQPVRIGRVGAVVECSFVFTVEALLLGALAAMVVGLSKTAVPGAGMLTVPLVATVVEGRLIAGTSLPLLLVADVFAVSWYRHHTRWDLLRPIAPWVGLGFAAGTAFYVVVGSSVRPIDVTIGVTIMAMVVIQTVRMIRRRPPRPARSHEEATYGAAGGFTTFVSNSAGPVVNTYLLGLGLGRDELIGTSAWFYFAVNLAKIPIYLTLGWFATGGAFFTGESLLWDLTLVPMVAAGVYLGKWALPRISQEVFVVLVLVLSAIGGLRLLIG